MQVDFRLCKVLLQDGKPLVNTALQDVNTAMFAVFPTLLNASEG